MAAIIFANCAVLDGTHRERREDHHVLVEGEPGSAKSRTGRSTAAPPKRSISTAAP